MARGGHRIERSSLALGDSTLATGIARRYLPTNLCEVQSRARPQRRWGETTLHRDVMTGRGRLPVHGATADSGTRIPAKQRQGGNDVNANSQVPGLRLEPQPSAGRMHTVYDEREDFAPGFAAEEIKRFARKFDLI